MQQRHGAGARKHMSTKDIHENHEPAPPLGLGLSEGLGPDAPTVGWYQNGRLTLHQPPGVSYAVCIRIEAEKALARAVALERERWRSAAHCAVTAGYDDLPDALHALGELLRA
jgi:hypothetical protein